MSQLKFLNAELTYAMHMLKHSTKATTAEIMWKQRIIAIQEEISEIKANVFSKPEGKQRMSTRKILEYCLDDWTDEELIEELDIRNVNYHHNNKDIRTAIDCYKRGDIKETMLYLERAFPELYNISKKVNL
jgi:uncharacterized protein (DUF433 family)